MRITQIDLDDAAFRSAWDGSLELLDTEGLDLSQVVEEAVKASILSKLLSKRCINSTLPWKEMPKLQPQMGINWPKSHIHT